MSDIAAPRAKIDLGRVIGRTFGVIKHRLGLFVLLSAVLVGVPAVISALIQGPAMRAAANGVVDPFSRYTPATIVVSLIAFCLSMLLQGALIRATADDLNGRKAEAMDYVRNSVGLILPFIGLMIIVALVVGLGSILIVVGLIFGLAWSVVLPVYALERPAFMQTFKRSGELTKGNRWRILGLGVLFFIAIVLMEMPLGIFSMAAGAVSGPALTRIMIFAPIIGMVTTVFAAVGVTVLYAELRQIKDGVGTDGVAAVFD